MISLFKVFMAPEAIQLCNDTLQSGMLTQANKVQEYEAELRLFLSQPHVTTVNSATSGLTIVLRMLQHPTDTWPGFSFEDDHVLSCPLTCAATNWPCLSHGMSLRWVDVTKNGVHIDLIDLEQKLNSHSKVIMIVHIFGVLVNMVELQHILDRFEITYGFRPMVVEDCAQAFGAKMGRLQPNNFRVYSTQAIKHLTTGDGGFIISPCQHWEDKAKLLRWYGISREQNNTGTKDSRSDSNIVEFGYKMHMNDINASIGIGNIHSIQPIIDSHAHNGSLLYNFVDEMLVNICNVHSTGTENESVWWVFPFILESQQDIKDDFIGFCKERNVASSQVHFRNDTHTVVEKFTTMLPHLDKVEHKYMCIPCGWWVSEVDIEHIKQTLLEWDLGTKRFNKLKE
jgi:dTDP-4-amino-4,6-dideoxygalactose transaminase